MKIVYGQSQSAAFVAVAIVANNKKVDKKEKQRRGTEKERKVNSGEEDTLCY